MQSGESSQHGIMHLGQDHMPHASQHTRPGLQFEEEPLPVHDCSIVRSRHSGATTQPTSSR
jgi:hypothetical protein